MAVKKQLWETLDSQAFNLGITRPDIPDYITDNLRYELYDWQEEALVKFLTYEKIKEVKEDINPDHLMFNMATGTGKTLVMAALILYYYKQGYRNFIFFVNQNNIVGKTEENLLNPSHNKYLYQKTIVIDEKTVNIKKVENFTGNPEDTEDIQILFTSIHKLHNSVYQVKENNVFLEGLQGRDLILLGDEAHNFNTSTKQKNKQTKLELKTEFDGRTSQKDIERSWEHTVVDLILKRGKKEQDEKNNNALLEFTATIPSNKEVVKKYLDKVVYKFELKDFLNAGYTKEINLVSSSFDKKKRIMQALLFNWYRHKMALKYKIPNFKPVILFRSKYVDKSKENNSADDYQYFQDIISDLSPADFDFLEEINEEEIDEVKETYQKGKSRILDIKHYLDENAIPINEIIDYLKDAFAPANCIITNSKYGTKTKEKTDEETERLLNNLEDKNNPIQAIFTVKRLTEGWDVLNLYDIVRLYEGRTEGASKSGRKAGESTVSEVQLIGRGVRYYPFSYKDKPILKRKFDNGLEHDLRVLEEFYFHCEDDIKYIDELKRELKKQDLLPEKPKVVKKFQLKLDFQESEFADDLTLYKNERIDNPNRRKRSLKEIKNELEFEYKIPGSQLTETWVQLDEGEKDKQRLKVGNWEGHTLRIKLDKFERHIIQKAINVQAKKANSIFRFHKLKEELEISSINDLTKAEFLGDVIIHLIVPKSIKSLSETKNRTQVDALVGFFGKIDKEIKRISKPHKGSEFRPVRFKEYSDWTKEKSVVEEPANDEIWQQIKDKNWYVLDNFYGTSEERGLIKFLMNTMGNFEQEYEEVYLLRNEEVYKIYDYEEGRGFQPDFLLFLKSREEKLYYQVFIEPKGDQFKDAQGGFADSKEGWKETFLEQISKDYGHEPILKSENKEYKLIGLPLYNDSLKKPFQEAVDEYLEVKELI